MGNTIRGSTAGCEGNLEEGVDSFHLSIGLEMKGGCLDVGNLKDGRKGIPKGKSEIGTTDWVSMRGIPKREIKEK